MTISFSQIPVGIRVPGQYAEFSNVKATSSVDGLPSRGLILAQMFATGSAVPGVPFLCRDPDQVAETCGQGSMAHAMAEAWKKANSWTETWMLPVLDDAAGTAATGAITVTAPPTAASTLILYIAGTRVRASLSASDTAPAVAIKIAAAITAGGALPVTAAVDGVDDTKVNLSCRWKGETGNDIDLRGVYHDDETQATGLALTFTAMAGGAGNPDAGDAIAALGDTWWTDVANPWTDTANHDVIDEEAARRWAPLVAMDMHIWTAHRGTLSESTTLGEARNSKHITTMATGASPTPPWVWAAAMGGVGVFYLKQDPGRPLQTLELPGILPPKREDRWGIEERNLLLYAGMATHKVTEAGAVQIERAITGYRNNAWGYGDESYLDVQTLRLLATLRYSLRVRIAQRFPRHKLRDDNGRLPAPGAQVATPKVIKGEIVALASAWIDREWIEDLETFKSGLIVQINADDPNRVDALVPPDVINQFRVFAGLVEFIL
ncbi:MAG: phage tail sheath subtilisin-like domain-containing protein [Rhodospirillum sp.]|nr:phage tail sheath subtilisin-like domain-containing protein [Rhodospirillum sp.]MCF8500182.1 phage tail sheath subtilisin-like domain-containing protein [Rhodospirillum sp.]